jgi:phospholipid/cholesterol/gamma-HCH transport system substrate-binding protein
LKLTKEIKTGLYALLALGMVIWGFNFLKGRNIFVGRTHFYAVYDNINGILPNSPVLINGMRVGQVKEIDFATDKSGKIILHIILNNNQLPIPKNTVAQIYSLDMLGAKGVQLLLGNSTEMAVTGDTLLSSVDSGITEEISKQLLPIKSKAENLIVSIDSMVASTRIIFDSKSQNNIRNTIERLNNTVASIDNLMADERDRISAITKNIESITTNIKKNNDKLANIIKNLNSISDSLAKAQVASTINNVDRTMRETALIMEKINKGQGSLGLLVNNDSLYNNLSSASRDLDKLLEDMRLNPKRYVHFSVFGNKEKSEKKKKK